MRNKLYWGLGVLIVLLICVSVFLFEKYMDPEPELLRRPPPGETYTTGHYDGDKWHRTVPPDPETIYIDGEAEGLYEGAEGGGELTYAELKEKDGGGLMSDRRVYGKYAVEHYPYSELALNERYRRAEKDEKGKRIWDAAILVPRYKAMLKWHSDSPRLLYDLAALLEEDSPAEAIKYGEEALKYTHLYPANTYSGYWTYPERIHGMLGHAYQRVADYDSALVHLKAAVKLIKAHPGRYRDSPDTYIDLIKYIEKGDPLIVPPTPDFEFDSDDYDPNLPPPPGVKVRTLPPIPGR